MTKKKEELFEYEDEPSYKPFDFINKDLDLLFIVVFIEAFKESKTELNFADFFKGNYWDIDQVSSEVSDTNDYYSVPDMVLEQVLFIFEDMRMGKVTEVGIDNTDEAIKDILIEVAKIGPENARKEAPNYSYPIEQLFSLQFQERQKIEKAFEENPESFANIREKLFDKSIFFSKEDGYFRKLQHLIIDAPTHILFKVKYCNERIQEIEEEISSYLDHFQKDEYTSNLPRYQEKRYYFSQQIESFYRYISRLNLIGDTINIPFTILSENGFEAVKILLYLQQKNTIKIRWSDEGSWKVQFLKLPITPESLLGAREKVKDITNLKYALSFNEVNSMLMIGEHSFKVQGPDQKEFLKIIFKDQKELSKEWFFSEIAELYDYAGGVNDKKFYNASYQLNLKVAQKTPIKDFLITTKQSVRINPKYL